eukprot:69899-Alexandrium_andersonii.AAC.1
MCVPFETPRVLEGVAQREACSIRFQRQPAYVSLGCFAVFAATLRSRGTGGANWWQWGHSHA